MGLDDQFCGLEMTARRQNSGKGWQEQAVETW